MRSQSFRTWGATWPMACWASGVTVASFLWTWSRALQPWRSSPWPHPAHPRCGIFTTSASPRLGPQRNAWSVKHPRAEYPPLLVARAWLHDGRCSTLLLTRSLRNRVWASTHTARDAAIILKWIILLVWYY